MAEEKKIFLIERKIVAKLPESLEEISTFGRNKFDIVKVKEFRESYL